VTGTVTYLEMTARAQLNQAAVVPGLSLEPLDRDRDSPLIAGLLSRIGAPYGWKPAQLAEEEWPAWFGRCQARMFWLLSLQGEPAGMTAYDLHFADDVEIETFGLLPEFVGKGLGGYALTLAVQRAWELGPGAGRVWLRTSTLDHPHALANYHRRGFRAFKTRQPG
jgi:GNAT superfamily N-acetyltransferase